MKSTEKRERRYIARITYSLLMAALLIGTWSCEHDTDTPDGPNLIDRFGPFEVFQDFEASTNTVDFSNGGAVFFTAEFNKNIDWVITITGKTNGAVKRIEGFDRFITEENANWNGSVSDLPFFTNDTCSVVITVPEEPDYVDSLEVVVIGTRNYPGVLVTDFENEPGSCIQLGNFEFELVESGRVNDNIAGEGEYFYRLQGTDNESGGPTDNFFVGLATIFPCVNGSNPYFEVPTVVPENFYLNCMIEGRNSQETRAIVTTIFDTNNSGGYEDGIDQGIEFIIDPLYEGWRLQSVNMGALSEETGFNVTSELLEKIVAMRLILISRNDIQPSPRLQVGFNTDYITFTSGAPLQP